MPWTKMVDMERSDDDKLDAMACFPSVQPDYPPGLRICFCSEELKKLGLDVPDIGDMIDMRAMGTVTSVSIDKTDGDDRCRVEIQIERIALENEAKE
jgi:hypothetical protein